MKILALVSDAFGGHGGIAQANCDVMSALAEGGGRVLVLPRSGGDAGPLPAGVRQAKPIRSRALYCANVLGKALTDGPFDAVFCGHTYLSPLAATVSRALRIPLWCHLHGIEAWNRPSPLIRASVERSAMVTAVSRYTRRQFLSWAKIPPERVHILPNTVRKIFSPGPPDQALISRYGLSQKKILLTVGRLSKQERYKGHDRILSALPRLLQDHPSLVYLIVGQGNDKSRLEARVSDMGLSKSVVFTGQVSEKELVEIYRFSDVFVMPSEAEGFGIVFLEAAASGLPILAANCGGSSDAVSDNETGVLVDPNDDERLIEGIRKLLKTGKRVPETVRRYSMENFAKYLKKILGELDGAISE